MACSRASKRAWGSSGITFFLGYFRYQRLNELSKRGQFVRVCSLWPCKFDLSFLDNHGAIGLIRRFRANGALCVGTCEHNFAMRLHEG